MKRYWRFNRDWWKNLGIFKRIHWTFLNPLLLSLLIIFSFLYSQLLEIKWLILIIIILIIFIFLSWKWLIASIFMSFFSLLFFTFMNNQKNLKEINGNYRITQVISNGYIIDHNFEKILIKTKNILNIDDLIEIKTNNLESLKMSKDKYSLYLRSMGIKYVSKKTLIKKINHNNSLRAKIINYLTTGPEQYVKYISLILLGKKNDSNKDLYEKVKYISILHLFVISGFHINLLFFCLLWIAKKIKIKFFYANFLGFIMIIIYLYILNFPIPGTKALIFTILIFLNKEYFGSKLSKLNILNFIFLGMFLSNPFIIFSLSFIFTFIINFAILFVCDSKNKNKKVILVSLFAYLSSIGISIQINGWINIFGIVNSIIFMPFIIINYIISIFGFPLKEALNIYFSFFDNLITIFYKNSFIINIVISNELNDLYYMFLFTTLIIIHNKQLIKNSKITAISNSNKFFRN